MDNALYQFELIEGEVYETDGYVLNNLTAELKRQLRAAYNLIGFSIDFIVEKNEEEQK